MHRSKIVLSLKFFKVKNFITIFWENWFLLTASATCKSSGPIIGLRATKRKKILEKILSIWNKIKINYEHDPLESQYKNALSKHCILFWQDDPFNNFEAFNTIFFSTSLQKIILIHINSYYKCSDSNMMFHYYSLIKKNKYLTEIFEYLLNTSFK